MLNFLFKRKPVETLEQRKSRALDMVRTNVMAADKDLNITYMNPAIIEMLGEAQEDLRKDLPHFNVDNLIGQNIDVFHKNPAHQRRMLAELTKPFSTTLLIGGRIFNLVVSPMPDKQGNNDGFVVEWQVADDAAKVSSLEKSQAMIQFQMDGSIISANQNFLDVMGYTLEEIKDQHHRMFVSPEFSKGKEYQEFWERLNKGETFNDEFLRYRKDGSEVWIQASYNPILNNHGQPVRIVKYATDVTELVRQRQQAQILSLVANNTDNSVIITDSQERIEYVNPGFENMTGYKAEDVMGKKPGDFLQGAATDPETKKEIRRKIEAQQPFYNEILNYHKNGTPYWISLSINPILDKDGNLERFISIQANVTETKEKALRFQGCIEAIEREQATIEFDMQGNIQRANENFLNTMGYSLEEIKGKHHRMFAKPDYAQSAEYAEFWKRLGQGEFISGEFCRLRKDGKEVWLQASYTPIQDAFGEFTSVIKYALDVTEQVQVKKENERGMEECMAVLQEVANGTLTRKMEDNYQGAFGGIKSSLNDTIDKLISIVQKVKVSAQSVSTAANEISSGSLDLSGRTEQQASSLEETAASMEQLTGTVRQNSDNATQASSLAGEARGVADEGGAVVNQTVEAMSSIEKSSQKISDIIGVIDEIAFQTNLLALNAAVEAARAGEAGKGFAVVASEVRSLAGRSASASKEIKSLIEASGQQVRNGVELADKAGATLKEIVDSVREVTTLVSDIATASKEQAAGIDEVSSAVSQMDEMTQQNAALVEENTAAAQSLLDQAQELDKLMAFFKLDDSDTQSVETATVMPMPTSTPKTVANGKANGHMPAVAASSAGKAAVGSEYDVGWEEF